MALSLSRRVQGWLKAAASTIRGTYVRRRGIWRRGEESTVPLPYELQNVNISQRFALQKAVNYMGVDYQVTDENRIHLGELITMAKNYDPANYKQTFQSLLQKEELDDTYFNNRSEVWDFMEAKREEQSK